MSTGPAVSADRSAVPPLDARDGRPIETRITIWLVGVGVASVAFQALAAWLWPGAGMRGSGVLAASFAIAAATGYAMARRGRPHAGLIVSLAAVAAASLGATFLVSGLGLLLAPIVYLVFALTALRIRWAPGRATAMVLLGLSLASALVLVDELWPWARQPVAAQDLAWTAGLGLLVILAFALGAARVLPLVSLRAQMVVAFVTVSATAVGLVSVLSYQTVRLSLLEDVETQALGRAKAAATALAAHLAEQIGRLQAFSVHGSLAAAALAPPAPTTEPDADPDERWRREVEAGGGPLTASVLDGPLAAELRRFAARFPDHREVMLTDARGRLLAASSPTSDYRQDDEAWWRRAWRGGHGGVYVGAPAHDASAGIDAVVLAVALPAGTAGTAPGVLRSTYHTTSLAGLLESLRPADAARLELLTDGGRRFAGAGPAGVDDATLARLRAAGGGVIRANAAGALHLVALAPVAVGGGAAPAGDWWVVLSQDLGTAMAPLDDLRRHEALLGLLVAALSALVAVRFSRVVGRPLGELSKAAQRMAEGDEDVRTGVPEGTGEIHRLARHLEEMSTALARRRAEAERQAEALARSRRLAHATLDSLQAHVAIVDAGGRVTAVNEAWRRFARDTAAAIAATCEGADYLGVCDRAAAEGDDVAAEAARGLRRLLSGEIDAWELEYPCHAPDAPHWYVARGTPLLWEGERRAVVAHHEVTALKLAEAKVRESERAVLAERESLAVRVEERTAELAAANEELQRAARLKDEFLASMSHELRTPLTAVIGLAEALLEGVEGPLSDGQRESLGIVQESGQHLLELINDVLDLAKIGAGKLSLHAGWVDVAAVCGASWRLIEDAARAKGLVGEVRVEPDLGLLWADERRLKQILVNLLSNAVKFTPEGGSVELAASSDDDGVRFAVRDTGIGIPRDDLRRLFEPFEQGDRRLSRRHPGTGLGLTLVQRMTALHGGRVEVESEPGTGSRFSLVLPRGDETASAAAPAGPRPDATGPRYGPGVDVLLVDDNEANVRVVRGFLERRLGCRVRVAEDGFAAERMALAETPELILMDVAMPGRDGLATTAALRAHPRLARVPIVAVTALAMPGDRERCLAAGMDDYLTKPVSLATLRRTLARHRGAAGRSDAARAETP